jgi:multicomponent Na+:H+ antiporter subunit F
MEISMKFYRWLLGTIILAVIIGWIIFRPIQVIFPSPLPYTEFVSRAFYIVLLAAMMCLFRVIVGPSTADRVVAVHILGVMMVGICALLALSTGHSWYIDIGIAWGLQAFICILALSKNLEGKGIDD